MDLQSLENLINLAQCSGHEKQLEASRILDQLRTSHDRWSVGLNLFFESQQELPRYFGLSLTREYLAFFLRKGHVDESIRKQIRESIMNWTLAFTSSSVDAPNFLVNNVISIITLLTKADYPEIWPSAFSDLLLLGSQSVRGLRVVVGVLLEAETEIVQFDDSRTKDEVKHNTVIKDAIRTTSAAKDIIDFLLGAIAAAHTYEPVSLSVSALASLTNLVGWVDINLVVNERALSILYHCLSDGALRGAACDCLAEVVKKGMDLSAKLATLSVMGICSILASVPLTSEAVDAANRKISGDFDDESNADESFGYLVDVLFLEMLTFWESYEASVILNALESPPEFASLPPNVENIAARMLHQTWALALRVFQLPDTFAAVSVLPSMQRLVALMRTRKADEDLLAARAAELIAKSSSSETGSGSGSSREDYFVSKDCLRPLLLGLLKQLQFEEDFSFDPSDEDDAAVLEAKKDVRKLFVNICRVYPEHCLDLISYALQSLPLPMSSAPFPAVEATLKLMLSFSECGVKSNPLINRGVFPALINTLHQTDIAYHPHAQVVLAYYELAVRYARLSSQGSIEALCSHMAGGARVQVSPGGRNRICTGSGVRHPDFHVRCRSAYFLFKLMEAAEGKSYALLDTCVTAVGSFEDLLVSDFPASVTNKAGRLSEAAEVHLMEAFALMTSSSPIVSSSGSSSSGTSGDGPSWDTLIERQQAILQELLHAILQRLRALTTLAQTQPSVVLTAELLSESMAHRVGCISSLAKGYTFKSRPDVAPLFMTAAEVVLAAVLSVAEAWSGSSSNGSTAAHEAFAKVRSKAVIYLHRTLVCVGEPSLNLIGGSALALLIAFADHQDIDQIVQLLNQALAEYTVAALPLLVAFYGPLLERLVALCRDFDTRVGREESVADAERALLQKQYLLLLQTILSNGCERCLVSPQNEKYIEYMQNSIVLGLSGQGNVDGDDSGSCVRLSSQAGLPLRKYALCSLTALVKAWGWGQQSDTGVGVGVVGDPTGLFWRFLCDRGIPTVLRLCRVQRGGQLSGSLSAISGGTSGSDNKSTRVGNGDNGDITLDTKDAVSLSIIGEVGIFLYTLYCVNPGYTTSYLQDELLPSLGWPATAISAVTSIIGPRSGFQGATVGVGGSSPPPVPITPAGTVRDNFKKLITSLSGC